MTTNEIKERIDILNNRRFFLAMKDTWSREDFKRDDELLNEITTLEKMLKEKK